MKFRGKYKAIIVIGILLAFSAILSSCGYDQMLVDPNATATATATIPEHTPGTDPEQGYLTYKEDLFKIEYPRTWVIESNENHNLNVVFKAPNPNENENNFLTTVNVSVVDLGETEIEFSTYINDVKSKLESNYEQYSLVSEKDDSYGGINGTTLVYDSTIVNYSVRSKQFIGNKDNYLYIITYIAQDDNYDSYLETADSIFNTFEQN